MSTQSPNMNLIIPTVGSDFGPAYAVEINQSLTTVDQHNHTPGSGVQITPAGLNINTNLTMQNNNLLAIGQLVFTNQSTASNTPGSLYIAPGGAENDLWFTDSAGGQVQITKGGIVNSTASAIPGEAYSGGTFIWTQTQSSLPTTPANFDIGSITIRPNTAATTNGIQLTPPGSISSLYTLTLPTLPGSKKIMTLDNTGVITATYDVDGTSIVISSNLLSIGPSANIVGTQLSASANILGSQLSPSAGIVGTQIASATVSYDNLAAIARLTTGGSGAFSTNSATEVIVTNMTIPISVASNRGVLVTFNGDFAGSGGANNIGVIGNANLGGVGVFRLYRDTTLINQWATDINSAAHPAGALSTAPVGSLTTMDFPGTSGTYTYQLRAFQNSGGNASANFITMTVIEI